MPDAPAPVHTPPKVPDFDALAAQHFGGAPAPSAPTMAEAPKTNTPQPPAAAASVTPAPKAEAPAAEVPAEVPEKKTVSIFDKTTKKEPAAPKTAEPASLFAHIEPPENMSPKAADNWKKLQTEAAAKIAAAEKRVADHETQLATYRAATPAENAETARLKEQLTKMQDRLAVLDIKEHPDFQSRFVQPRTAAVAEVSDILGYNDKKVPDMALLLSKNPKEFNAAVAEMTNGLNSMDATTVQTSMRQAYQLSQQERAALGNSGELHKQLTAKSAAAQKQAFEDSFKELGIGDGMIEPMEIPDDASPEEKAEIQSINSTFAGVRPASEQYAFKASTPKDLARISQKAALHDVYLQTVIPRMDKEHRAMTDRALKAEKELAAIKKAKNPGSFVGDPGKGGAAHPNEDLAQMATRMFSSAPQ